MTFLRTFDIIFTEFHENEVKYAGLFYWTSNYTKNEELISSLKQTIIDLIDKGVTTFLFGSKSEFNDLSWKTVTALKTTYPFIKRIYVRSDYKSLSESYEKYLLNSYEETYFSPKLKNAGKSSYIKRNYEMIDNSTYCVFYYNKNYVARLIRPTKHNILLHSTRNSGTKIAYDYAIKKCKTIINLYK